MGIFLRFILPSLFRRCLDHPIGPHSPMLHFCREPNLYRAGENHSVAAGSALFLWGTTPHASIVVPPMRILPLQRAAHRYRLLSSPIRRFVLGLVQFWLKVLPTDLGTKRWNRTTDIRDMSPLFCRLNYLGICIRAPHVSIEAVLDGFLLHLSEPSAH